MSVDRQGFAIGRLSVDLDTHPKFRQFGATLDHVRNSPILINSNILQLRFWRWTLMVMWR